MKDFSNENSIKVSVIMPNYNHGQYLKERLESILNQSYQNFELIILDDCSTDNSLEIISIYKTHPKVANLLVNSKNSGSPFKQWKKGIELAKGELIWIAESDDSCELNFLESQVRQIGDADLVVAKTLVIEGDNITKTEHTHPVFMSNDSVKLDSSKFLSCPITNVSAILFKNVFKIGFDKTEFNRYSIIGDVVFYFEFFYNKKIKFNPLAISYFRHQQHGLSNLIHKDLRYFRMYFNEHFTFIKYAIQYDYDSFKQLFKPYIIKYFNKIRNRQTVREKLSLMYLLMYIKFKYLLYFGIR